MTHFLPYGAPQSVAFACGTSDLEDTDVLLARQELIWLFRSVGVDLLAPATAYRLQNVGQCNKRLSQIFHQVNATPIGYALLPYFPRPASGVHFFDPDPGHKYRLHGLACTESRRIWIIRDADVSQQAKIFVHEAAHLAFEPLKKRFLCLDSPIDKITTYVLDELWARCSQDAFAWHANPRNQTEPINKFMMHSMQSFLASSDFKDYYIGKFIFHEDKLHRAALDGSLADRIGNARNLTDTTLAGIFSFPDGTNLVSKPEDWNCFAELRAAIAHACDVRRLRTSNSMVPAAALLAARHL